MDDSITIIALALLNALKQSQVQTKDELAAMMELLVRFMSKILEEVIDDESMRTAIINASIQRAGQLIDQQQSVSNVGEALQFIRHSVETIWCGVSEGKANLDQAVPLLVVVGLAALRNCSISNASELCAHMEVFFRFMLVVADQCAPKIPADLKRKIIEDVWKKIVSMF